MAAGNVIVYQHALEDINLKVIDLASITFAVALVQSTYTPVPESHSSFDTEISSNMTTASGYGVQKLTGQTLTRSTKSHVMFDANDLTISATAVMKVKWAVGYVEGTKRPVFYCDLETTSTTGVEATQVVLQWNSAGIFRYNNPGA